MFAIDKCPIIETEMGNSYMLLAFSASQPVNPPNQPAGKLSAHTTIRRVHKTMQTHASEYFKFAINLREQWKEDALIK